MAPQLPRPRLAVGSCLQHRRVSSSHRPGTVLLLMPAQYHFVSGGGLTKLREAGGHLQGGTAGPPCPSAAMQLLACTATIPDSCVAQDWPILYPRGLWCQELRCLRFSAGPDAPFPLPPSSAAGTKCSGWQVSGSARGTLLASTAGSRAHGSGLCTMRSQSVPAFGANSSL